jgi:hypothetical protein
LEVTGKPNVVFMDFGQTVVTELAVPSLSVIVDQSEAQNLHKISISSFVDVIHNLVSNILHKLSQKNNFENLHCYFLPFQSFDIVFHGN